MADTRVKRRREIRIRDLRFHTDSENLEKNKTGLRPVSRTEQREGRETRQQESFWMFVC